jgi:Zn-dependent protease
MDMTNEQLLFGLVWYMVFIISITLHEAAHAWAAKLLGDSTAYSGGQVTVNPLPHMQREPFGTILMPALSFFFSGGRSMIGWASAPYDPFWAARYPRRAALMALAGPLANLLLAVAAALAIRVTDRMDWFVDVPKVDQLLTLILLQNLLLFFFNLLPLPPLDGSAIIQLVMRQETAIRWQMAMRQPHLAILGMIAAWAVFGRLWPVLSQAAIDVLFWPGGV